MEEEKEAWVLHPHHHHHHHHHGRHIGISPPPHADVDRSSHDDDEDDDTWTNPGTAPTMSVITEEETRGCGATRKHGMQPQVIYGYYILRSAAEGWSGSSETMPWPDTKTTTGGAPRREDNMSRIRHGCRDYVTAEIRNEEVAFFGVFDDHGGDGEVGRWLASTLLDAILTQGGGLGSDPAGATRDAYLRTDRRILAELGPARGGATAVTAMILHAGARLIVANVGDARAVLCKDGAAVQLSVDHVADRLVERANVEMRGGHIITFPEGLLVVFLL